MLDNYVLSHFLIDIIFALRAACAWCASCACVCMREACMTCAACACLGGCLVASGGRARQLLDVVRGVAWCAWCETLRTRLPCVFHGLNSQEKLDTCRLFCACHAPRVPLGSRLARLLLMLTRWTLHGSILATCAELAALGASAFHKFPTIKKSLIVAIWCNFCTIYPADGVQKCLFWNYSNLPTCPPCLVPCGFPDFFYFFAFFSCKVTCNMLVCVRNRKGEQNAE